MDRVAEEDQKTSSAYQESKIETLLAFWDTLTRITQLTFHAKTQSKEEKGWNGKGQGEVLITKECPHTLLFSEKGTWHGKQSGEVSFSNIFRWTLNRNRGLISLEHLRRGPDNPVFLFHLAPIGKHSLASVDPHLCKRDRYFAQIHFDSHGLHLHWRIIGPKKNEKINYYYS